MITNSDFFFGKNCYFWRRKKSHRVVGRRDLCFDGRRSDLAYQGLFGPSLSILILAHGAWAARGHHGPSGAGLFSRGRRATQHQLDRLRPESPPSQKSAWEPKYALTSFVGRKFE